MPSDAIMPTMGCVKHGMTGLSGDLLGTHVTALLFYGERPRATTRDSHHVTRMV